MELIAFTCVCCCCKAEISSRTFVGDACILRCVGHMYACILKKVMYTDMYADMYACILRRP